MEKRTVWKLKLTAKKRAIHVSHSRHRRRLHVLRFRTTASFWLLGENHYKRLHFTVIEHVHHIIDFQADLHQSWSQQCFLWNISTAESFSNVCRTLSLLFLHAMFVCSSLSEPASINNHCRFLNLFVISTRTSFYFLQNWVQIYPKSGLI